MRMSHPQIHSGNGRHLLADPKIPLFIAAAAFLCLYLPTIVWLYHRWMMGVWFHSHGVLIPIISGLLIWKTVKSRQPPIRADSCWLGLSLMLPAVLLHILDTVLWTQILSAVSLVPAIIGLSFLLFGRLATQSILFPLLLLFLMIPVPSVAIQPIILFLRNLSAYGVSLILPIMGVPFLKTGTLFELHNATVNIDNPCSGFATLSATLAFTIVAIYLWPLGMLRSSALVLIAVPVAIVANIFRNLILFVLVINSGPEVLDTILHSLSGYAMYIIAISLQGWLLFKFRKKSAGK